MRPEDSQKVQRASRLAGLIEHSGWKMDLEPHIKEVIRDCLDETLRLMTSKPEMITGKRAFRDSGIVLALNRHVLDWIEGEIQAGLKVKAS